MTRVLPELVVLAALTAADPANASEMFGFPLRLGVFGGWHATAGDYDVLGERRADLVPGTGPMFGLRFGVRLAAAFTVEAEVGFVPASVDVLAAGGGRASETAWLLPAHVDCDWRALEGVFTPIVGLGLGLVANIAGPGSGDADALFSGSAGVEVRLGDAVALRLEGGVLVSDAVDAAVSWTPVVTLGVDVLFWRARPEPERFVGPEDPPTKKPTKGCPAGVRSELCRDSDDDGLIDAFDPCPAQSDPRGCADPDKDGVIEPRDACPRDRGERVDWGCPR